MIHPILALAVMVTGQCYYGTPATYVYPTYTYACPVTCGEHQIIRNTGPICSKFYMTVTLNDGYRTSIPVINCKLPRITYQTSRGSRTLVLDYSTGFAYSNFAGRAVKYTGIQRVPQRTAPTPAIRSNNEAAPAPRFPTDPTTPRKVPLIEPTTPTPGPIGPAPGLTTPTDKQIEELLNRVQKLEEKAGASIGMPTMKAPRITVQENKVESMKIPSAPTLPKDIAPSEHPDNITKPTYD